VAKRLENRKPVRRAAVLVTVLAAAGGIAVYSGAEGAGAAPAPTISQVQKEVNALQGKVDKIGQEYDAAGQQLAAAKARLTQVTKQSDTAQQEYNQASATLAAVAVTQYENSGQTSILGLLTSGDPSAVLGQASLLLQVEGTRNKEAQQFLILANELATIKQQRQRTADGVAQLEAQYGSQKTSMTKLLDTQTSLLKNLTAQQQAAVEAQTVGGSTSSSAVISTPIAYLGPMSSQPRRVRLRPARQAVRVGRHRPECLRLLRTGLGRLGFGGRIRSAYHVRPVGGPAAHPDVRPPAR
jgi:hypothetical protein